MPTLCRAVVLMIEDICNFDEFDVPFSVAEYDIINDILNDHCHDLGGWIFFIKWAIMYVFISSDFLNLALRWLYISRCDI